MLELPRGLHGPSRHPLLRVLIGAKFRAQFSSRAGRNMEKGAACSHVQLDEKNMNWFHARQLDSANVALALSPGCLQL